MLEPSGHQQDHPTWLIGGQGLAKLKELHADYHWRGWRLREAVSWL